MTAAVLPDICVQEISVESGAARWCARLLESLGAEVTRDATGKVGPGSVVLIDEGAAASPGRTGMTELAAQGAVVIYFSGFGMSGPWAGKPSSEFVIQAASGIMSTNGNPQDCPLMAGVPVARATAALNGAIAALAALTADGGELVDISSYDACIGLLGTLMPTVFVSGEAPSRMGTRHPMSAPWNVYRAQDGWVALTTIGDSMWRRCAILIGRPELGQDAGFDTAEKRMARVDELDALVGEWTSAHSTQEILRAATEADIPAGDIKTLALALGADSLQRREVVHRVGERRVVGRPLRLTPIPRPGAGVQFGSPSAGHPPLSGLRVLEIGSLTSAPLAGRILAYLGADVIKVEPARGELSRHLATRVHGVGYLYFINNTDKRGRVVDVRADADRAALLELVRDADVFLTNMAGSTLRAVSLSADDLIEVNPALVYAGITGFGATAPAADKAFDTVIQAESGIMAVTGWPDGTPMKIGVSFADLMGGHLAAFGVLAAVLARKSSAAGWDVDVSMLDAALWSQQERWIGPRIDQRRSGNYEDGRTRGLIRCTDGIVIAVDASTEQSDALTGLVGSGLLPDVTFWTCGPDLDFALAKGGSAQVLEELWRLGVPAAPLWDLVQVAGSEHARARGMFVDQVLPGSQAITVIGAPMKFRQRRVEVDRPAPMLGGQPCTWHNRRAHASSAPPSL